MRKTDKRKEKRLNEDDVRVVHHGMVCHLKNCEYLSLNVSLFKSSRDGTLWR